MIVYGSCWFLLFQQNANLSGVNIFNIKLYSMSLSSVGIWAQGRKIIKHLRSWTLTEHDTFTLLPWCKVCILQRPGLTVMTAWLMLTSVHTPTLTSHTASLSGSKKSWRKLPTGLTESSQSSSEDRRKLDKIQFDISEKSRSAFWFPSLYPSYFWDVQSFIKQLSTLYQWI